MFNASLAPGQLCLYSLPFTVQNSSVPALSTTNCRMHALIARMRLPPPAVAGLILQLGSTFCLSLMSIVAKLAGQVG